MKTLKFFIITAVLLLFVATGAVGFVWLKLQNFLEINNSEVQTEYVEFIESEQTPIANTVPKEGLIIDSSVLSTEQKEIIEQIGIDTDSVVITQEMVSCAEKKLGTQRVEEILEGSTPTPLEGISLLGCL